MHYFLKEILYWNINFAKSKIFNINILFFKIFTSKSHSSLLLNYDFEIWPTLPRVQRRSKVTASLCIFTVSDKCIQSDPEREPGMRKERYSTTSYSCNTFSRVIQPNTVTLHTNTLYFSTMYYCYVVRCSSS